MSLTARTYELLYERKWAGSDIPLTYTAFACGLDAAIEAIAQMLADQPHLFEEARSEIDYINELMSKLEQSLRS